MSKNKIKIDISGLKQFQKELEQLSEQKDDFLQAVTKELAARLLAKVIRITPTGQYPKSSGKQGGTLKRGWTAKTEAEASGESSNDVAAFVNSINITKTGKMFSIEIINPVEYASYVEFGHRTRGGDGWVEGRFMLTISEQELQTEAPKVIERKLKSFLKNSI